MTKEIKKTTSQKENTKNKIREEKKKTNKLNKIKKGEGGNKKNKPKDSDIVDNLIDMFLDGGEVDEIEERKNTIELFSDCDGDIKTARIDTRKQRNKTPEQKAEYNRKYKSGEYQKEQIQKESQTIQRKTFENYLNYLRQGISEKKALEMSGISDEMMTNYLTTKNQHINRDRKMEISQAKNKMLFDSLDVIKRQVAEGDLKACQMVIDYFDKLQKDEKAESGNRGEQITYLIG